MNRIVAVVRQRHRLPVRIDILLRLLVHDVLVQRLVGFEHF